MSCPLGSRKAACSTSSWFMVQHGVEAGKQNSFQKSQSKSKCLCKGHVFAKADNNLRYACSTQLPPQCVHLSTGHSSKKKAKKKYVKPGQVVMRCNCTFFFAAAVMWTTGWVRCHTLGVDADCCERSSCLLFGAARRPTQNAYKPRQKEAYQPKSRGSVYPENDKRFPS